MHATKLQYSLMLQIDKQLTILSETKQGQIHSYLSQVLMERGSDKDLPRIWTGPPLSAKKSKMWPSNQPRDFDWPTDMVGCIFVFTQLELCLAFKNWRKTHIAVSCIISFNSSSNVTKSQYPQWVTTKGCAYWNNSW